MYTLWQDIPAGSNLHNTAYNKFYNIVTNSSSQRQTFLLALPEVSIYNYTNTRCNKTQVLSRYTRFKPKPDFSY
jgi:hypothetical protein